MLTPVLVKLFHELGVVQRGDFTLASGQKSDVYLDVRRATLHSRTAALIAGGLWGLLARSGAEFDAVGGMSLGADPIVGAMLTTHYSYFRPNHQVSGFLVRKEPKGHGASGLIAGNLQPGTRAVLVEDVATSGGSLMKAFAAATGVGAEVVAAVCVVDRQTGAAERLAGAGVPLLSLMTWNQLCGAEQKAGFTL